MNLSHPGKALEVHINGVLKKYCKNSNFAFGEVAVLFHDLGKLNPNFQKKLKGIPTKGYSNHAYLSVIIFYNFLLNNKKLVSDLLGANSKSDLKIRIWQVLTIIAHHHGNLPNLSNILNDEEILKAGNFITETVLEASLFIAEKLKIQHQHFNPVFNLKMIKMIAQFDEIKHADTWRPNALVNFMDTQFCFASLIEADKRDASNNELYILEEKIQNATKNLSEKLAKKFNEIDNTSEPSELNKLRTEIRKEAVLNVKKGLEENKRIFSLPAPTGAGKTYTLLAIAQQILKYDNKLGITYALPFLSITDQVQQILEDLEIECLPISSKSQNKGLESAQKNYEENSTQENLEELLKQSFSESSFDHPFILTTFVQFFETLVSNKNSTLLKLPNFCNRIFLIDEIQSLPPRLYIFFTAFLDAFCKTHNSYLVLSTGTMPKFNLPDKNYYDQQLKNPALIFTNFNADNIVEVINPKDYFEQPIFNRYKIDWIGGEEMNYDELIQHISAQKKSCLVILNTIADTRYLFNKIKNNFNNTILLNTHFVVQDRTEKINDIKEYLKKGEQVIVISTQLIEAGVDVDFPNVYRDLCPLPSLIQSAGRCNRNKLFDFGQVYLFYLKNNEGKRSADMVYRKEAAQFLKFCKSEIKDKTFEKDLFEIQSRFFEKINVELTIGEFAYDTDRFGNEYTYNFIECINNAEFEKTGRFKLILENKFGETHQYFVPESKSDDRYEKLISIMKESLSAQMISERFYYKTKMESALKNISTRLLTVRIKNKETAPLYSNSEEYFGIRVLSDLTKYSKETGIELGVENCLL